MILEHDTLAFTLFISNIGKYGVVYNMIMYRMKSYETIKIILVPINLFFKLCGSRTLSTT